MTTGLTEGPVDLYSLSEAYAEFKERCDELEAIVDGQIQAKIASNHGRDRSGRS
jgi:hypothetical protein